jgi:hypothetical protein
MCVFDGLGPGTCGLLREGPTKEQTRRQFLRIHSDLWLRCVSASFKTGWLIWNLDRGEMDWMDGVDDGGFMAWLF